MDAGESSMARSEALWVNLMAACCRKPASCFILALRNSFEIPILDSSAIVVGLPIRFLVPFRVGTTLAVGVDVKGVRSIRGRRAIQRTLQAVPVNSGSLTERFVSGSPSHQTYRAI